MGQLSRRVGGGEAIDLVIHLYGLDFIDAVAWLRSRFPDGAPAPSPQVASNPGPKLPMPHTGRLWAVKRSLLGQRRLSSAVVERLIRAGDVYADNHANAVFLLRGKHNTPVGDDMAQTMIQRYPAIKRLRPPRHDWNDLLRSLS